MPGLPSRSSTLPPRKNHLPRLPKKIRQETVYKTPWFAVERLHFRTTDRNLTPYFRLKARDGVFVLAITDQKEVILVRQFRPAIGAWTYEMPAGRVEKSQTPLQAAQRELWEETGYVAPSWKRLGMGRLMMDRYSAKMHGWLAFGARKKSSSKNPRRFPVQRVAVRKFAGWVKRNRFEQIGGLGFLFCGLLRYPRELGDFLRLER